MGRRGSWRAWATCSARLKNTRSRWLTRREHLSAARQAQQQKLLRSGLATVRAWTRLAALRDLAAQPFEEAKRDLKGWRNGALRTRVTNATAEALNGISQTRKRKARGYRTTRCFKTMILLVAGHLDLHLPNTIPALR